MTVTEAAVLISLEPEPDGEAGTPRGSRPPLPRLEVRAGRMTLLTGPPGCGKSRILRAAAGEALLPGARVLVGGHDLGAMPHRARRRCAASMRLFFLPEEPALLSNLTVLQNLLLPIRYLGERAEGEASKEAVALLDAAGLAWAAEQLPAQLSTEDRKTAALLRGFLRRPAAALLDDPLSGLDEDSLAGVGPLMKEALAVHGCAVLAAAKAPSLYEAFDPEIVPLAAGRPPAEPGGRSA